jgi:hypothetical protein
MLEISGDICGTRVEVVKKSGGEDNGRREGVERMKV